MSVSRIAIEMVGFDDPPSGPYMGQLSCSQKFSAKSVGSGNATNQLDAVLCIKQQIVASGNITIDLMTDLDRFGVALGATDVVAGMIENKGPGTGILQVTWGAANGWTALLKSSGGTDQPVVNLPPATGFCFWGLTKGALPVGAGDKTLLLNESGGANPVNIEAQFWVRR